MRNAGATLGLSLALIACGDGEAPLAGTGGTCSGATCQAGGGASGSGGAAMAGQGGHTQGGQAQGGAAQSGAAQATKQCGDALCDCPATPPNDGSVCNMASLSCTWGDHPARTCRTVGLCNTDQHWEITLAPERCTTLQPGCPSSDTEQCGDLVSNCIYPNGSECNCYTVGQPPSCSQPPVVGPECGGIVPNEGDPCDLPNGTGCGMTVCQGVPRPFGAICTERVWHWYIDITCGAVCASPDTPIATPTGERPISELQAGELVYSVHGQAILAVPVLRVRRQQVWHHHVVQVRTQDGRTLEISAPHPTADGRRFGDLHAGDTLDGAQISGAQLVPYSYPYTYDILPASDTGTYFAAGKQIGSTLSAHVDLEQVIGNP